MTFRFNYFICLFSVAVIFLPYTADAAIYNDGDACGGVGEPPAGSFYRENTVDGYHFLVCDGTTWNISQIIDFTLRNTAVGNNALDAITTSVNNVAIGQNALSSLTTEPNNIAIGSGAAELWNPSAGNVQIIALGYNAVSNNPGGSYRTIGIGMEALNGATFGNSNLAIGYRALQNITNGESAVVVGSQAGQNVSNAGQSIMVGALSGQGAVGAINPTGNVFIGYGTGMNITTNSQNNVFLGYQTGDLTTTGDNNILIGYDVDATSVTASNELNIGDTIYGDLANNYVGIANATPNVALDVTGSIEFTGTVTDVSDERLKTNIKPITNALLGLDQLKGVSFVMKDDPKRNVELGLIAQDVQKSFPELVKKSSDGVLSLNYQGMVGPMVSALQELKSENQALEKSVLSLTERLIVLEKPQDAPFFGGVE